MSSFGKSAKEITKNSKSYGSLVVENQNFIWNTEQREVQKTDNLIISEELAQNVLKKRIWTTMALLFGANFIFFMGISPVAMIQSSLNAEDGLGVVAMSIKDVFKVIGAFFAPYIISKIGCKSSILLGSILFSLFVPANFYPEFWTLIPTAVVSGIGCAIHAVAVKVYMAKLAHLYADVTKSDRDRINSRLFVLFIVSYKLSSALGNFVSSVILDAGVESEISPNAEMCGVSYCNEEFILPTYTDTDSDSDSSGSFQPSDENIRVLVLIGFCTLACCISAGAHACLKSLTHFGISPKNDQQIVSPLTLIRRVFKGMADYRHVLFMPMALIMTGGDTFWTADFTKAFITCTIGMQYLGYVSVWNGLSAALSSILLGWFNTKKVRSLPVACATLLQMITFVGLFYWVPSVTSLMSNYWTLSIFSIIFYFGSGIRHFIAPVLVSVIFKDDLETAFSVFHFWIYMSGALTFAWSNLLCIDVKMYILMATLALSFIGYVGMEVIVYRKEKSTQYRKLDNDEIN